MSAQPIERTPQGYKIVFDQVFCQTCRSYDVELLEVTGPNGNGEFYIVGRCENPQLEEQHQAPFGLYVTSLCHIYVPQYHTAPLKRWAR